MKDVAIRFMALYPGLDRIRGVWKKTNRAETLHEQPIIDHFVDHLNGDTGIGVVPIDDESMVRWGAIDIDAHEEGTSIDLDPIWEKIQELKLPLVLCQSKSQGAHLYLYLKDKMPASVIQGVLKKWASDIGHPGVEIFPKQKKLAKNQSGNWINLPYFAASKTARFAYAGRKLSLLEFLDYAEANQKTQEEIMKMIYGENHADAPPCIFHMLTQGGIGSGFRNNAMFNIAIYYKKVGVGDLLSEMSAVNKVVMPKPLTKREVVSVTSSVLKSDYGYRCNEDPIAGLCDKEVCKLKKYGIGQGNKTMFDDFLIHSLKKIMTDPPKYIVNINNQADITVDHETLFNFIRFQLACFAYADLVIPPIKSSDWQSGLKAVMEKMERIEAPEDVGPKAIIRDMLDEFTRICERLNDEGQPKYGNPNDVMRGIPVLVEGPDVIFRSSDFISFLKRKKAEEAKGADLWVILRNLGCGYHRQRIGEKVTRVWSKPANIAVTTFEKIEPKVEF